MKPERFSNADLVQRLERSRVMVPTHDHPSPRQILHRRLPALEIFELDDVIQGEVIEDLVLPFRARKEGCHGGGVKPVAGIFCGSWAGIIIVVGLRPVGMNNLS